MGRDTVEAVARPMSEAAVLCYSRMLFFQCYPTSRRFDCKVFLTGALLYFGGAAARIMIDNTHVVVRRGSDATWRRCRRGPPLASVSAFSSWRMRLEMLTVRRGQMQDEMTAMR
jgi:hypothetical protein